MASLTPHCWLWPRRAVEVEVGVVVADRAVVVLTQGDGGYQLHKVCRVRRLSRTAVTYRNNVLVWK